MATGPAHLAGSTGRMMSAMLGHAQLPRSMSADLWCMLPNPSGTIPCLGIPCLAFLPVISALSPQRGQLPDVSSLQLPDVSWWQLVPLNAYLAARAFESTCYELHVQKFCNTIVCTTVQVPFSMRSILFE